MAKKKKSKGKGKGKPAVLALGGRKKSPAKVRLGKGARGSARKSSAKSRVRGRRYA